MAKVIAAHANNATPCGQRAMAKRLKQGWHQFAPGQVASAAKQDKIKAHEQNFLRL
jgi:hypothetical protein